MKTPVLETERLVLRPLTLEDAELIYIDWGRDEEVARFMRWSPHQSVEETKEWLAREEAALMSGDVFTWGFVRKENQRLIGSGGLVFSKEHQMYELGYNLVRNCWGKGLATEAAERIVEFARESLHAGHLFATHALENMASGRVIEKLGFTYQNEGTYSSFDGSKDFCSKEYILNL